MYHVHHANRAHITRLANVLNRLGVQAIVNRESGGWANVNCDLDTAVCDRIAAFLNAGHSAPTVANLIRAERVAS